MKISLAPTLVVGGLLLGTLINTSLNNRQEQEELIKEIQTLDKENKRKDEEIRAFKNDLQTKDNDIKDKDARIKELEVKIKQTKASRGTTHKGKLLGTFEATAYTDNVASQGKWVGQTASGMKPQVGVIAVDPKVIPLGTKLYVEGYGNCIAGDTGGAIKGYRIDLFKNTSKECKEWGRRKVKVYKRD